MRYKIITLLNYYFTQEKVRSKMSKLPNNILFFLKQYQPKMTGNNDNALKAITQQLRIFNKKRSEQTNLRSISVYPYQDEKGLENELLYVVKIKGRKNTYYQNRILTFYLFFFDNYPTQPPEIVAGNLQDQVKKETRFLHINVAQNGYLCMGSNQLKHEYYQYTTLKEILVQLQSMIYYPNVQSSFNSQLYTAFSSLTDNTAYYKILNDQAMLLERNQSQSESQHEEEIESD